MLRIRINGELMEFATMEEASAAIAASQGKQHTKGKPTVVSNRPIEKRLRSLSTRFGYTDRELR